jgi:cell division protein FtsB
MNWLKYLVGISAIIIAGCAAYFSVTGLGVLFSGASIAVMIMAGSLEFAKLVTATYLKQTWSKTHGFNKIYLTLSVVILMVITSAGIFGYLSNAFQQQNLQLQQVDREIQVWNNKIVQDTAQIGQLTRQITELNQNQGRIIGDGRVNNRTLRSIDNRDVQIGKLQDKISVLQDSIVVFNEKINEIKTNNIGLEREVGGFRFVAEAFGVDINTVVKFFIFLIVIVFDPLAIALVIAFNGLISKKDEDTRDIVGKNYEIYGDSGKKSPNSEENPVIMENNQPNEPDPAQTPQRTVAQYDINSGGYTYS